MLLQNIFGIVAAIQKSGLFMSSSFTPTFLCGRTSFVKRDDLLDSFNGVGGNKARKLKFLAQRKLLPKYVASCGGVQSNSMLAIAKCCADRGIFYYFVKGVPPYLKSNPVGNFRIAIDLGMKVIVRCLKLMHLFLLKLNNS